MGNQLIKNYNIDQNVQFSGGVGGLWKSNNISRNQVHNANKISKSKELVSIFIFDKRNLDKMGIKNQQKEEILKLLRQEPHNLTTLKSSQILSQFEPLIEDPKRMVFVCEKVQSSLHAIIERGELSKYIQSDLDIKVHLLELIEQLSFLHSDAKLVHLNICPENIYVTATGKWKLSGLAFSTQILNDQLQELTIDFSPKPYDQQLKFHPNLAYVAPEVVSTPPQCSFKSDIFSIGMLLINLLKYKYEKNSKEFNIFETESIYSHRNNFKNIFAILQQAPFFQQLSQNLKELILSLISEKFLKRASLQQLYQSEFITDPLVQTINHMHRIEQMDIGQQQIFVQNLSKQFLQFEPIVIKSQILPKLIPMLLIEQLMPSVLSIIIEITKKKDYMTKVEYNNLIWTNMKNISTATSVPAKCLYTIVNNLPQFYNFVSKEEILNSLIPLYLKCLECSHFKLQESALKVTDTVVSHLDYIYTKNKILPRLLQLCLDSNPQIRTASINTLSLVHTLFDRTSISDLILPTIDKMRKQGFLDTEIVNPVFLMYQSFFESISNEVNLFKTLNKIAITKAIPSLLPFLLENNLTKTQILQFSRLIKNLIQKVEDDQIKSNQLIQPVIKQKPIPSSSTDLEPSAETDSHENLNLPSRPIVKDATASFNFENFNFTTLSKTSEASNIPITLQQSSTTNIVKNFDNNDNNSNNNIYNSNNYGIDLFDTNQVQSVQNVQILNNDTKSQIYTNTQPQIHIANEPQILNSKYDDLFNMDTLQGEKNQDKLIIRPLETMPQQQQNIFNNFDVFMKNEYIPLQDDKKNSQVNLNYDPFEDPKQSIPQKQNNNNNDLWGF